MKLNEKKILLVSYQSLNTNAWARLNKAPIGSLAYIQADEDIASSALKIDQLTREIAEIEDAESRRHNARIEDDERQMRGWQR